MLSISPAEGAVLQAWLPALLTYSLQDAEPETLTGLLDRVSEFTAPEA